MIPWIQVYSNLPQHPKTTKLADELGLTSAALNPNVLAVGILVSLWTWAVQNAYGGDLSGCSQRAIAEACQWRRKPGKLVDALQKAGYLDADMKLHDWEEYAYLLVEQENNRKVKTRERLKRYRNKKAKGDDPDCNVTDTRCNGDSNAPCNVTDTRCNGDSNAPCNVTDTRCNASTLPYPTIPDHTRPDSVTPPPDGVGVTQRARDSAPAPAPISAVLSDYLNRVNPMASQTSLDELRGYAETMGPDVCRRAIDIALDERKTSWSYIRAILRDKQQRGVRCLADWDAADERRGKEEQNGQDANAGGAAAPSWHGWRAKSIFDEPEPDSTGTGSGGAAEP